MFIRVFWLISGFALLFTCVGFVSAEGPGPAYSPEQFAAIGEARIRIAEIRDAEKDGDIAAAAADARVKRIVAHVNGDLSSGLTEAALEEMRLPNPVFAGKTVERKEGFFAGVDFLRLGLIAVFTILTILLIGRHLIYLLRYLPMEIWEIAVYLAGISLLTAQGAGFMAISQFLAFFGCLLIGGGLGLTFVIHRDYLFFARTTQERQLIPGKLYLKYACPAIMLATFSIATLITKSCWLGAFAALSLMTLLGFTGAVIPMGYAIGFRDKDALARATSAGLAVMALFMALHAGNISNPAVRAFVPGSLIVGGIVGYLGLLIAASLRYRMRQNWLIMQGIVLVVCFAGVIGASLLGLGSIRIIAGVILTLWTIEKMVEVPG